jgi:DegV family protein with EDD domain
MRERIKKIYEEILSPGRTFQEKLFIILTVIAAIAVFLVCIGDIIIGDNTVEVAILLGMLLFAFPIVYFTVKKKRTDIGALLIASGVVFMVLPVTYFFGGGITGGSDLWFTFAFLYVGLILVGNMRKLMLALLTLLVIAEYTIDYMNPTLLERHTRKMMILDRAVSAVLVGFIVYIMVYFLRKIFEWENEKTARQAQEIEELNKAQNRFFSSMSHEIRTPINTIIGLNEMILREDISDEVADDARNIRSASKILLSLINDILDMSKIESGKMDIVSVPYDVGAMLSEIVNMIWVRADEKGLKFTLDVDPSLPASLVSDEVRIKQILINLLNNAVKYTQEGSVTLSIHCHKTEKGKVLVTYSVEDTGMGIRKESIPYLFDAFRREDERKNRYIEGTGLGLSIVKQLVDLLGGEISVNSIYTKGSTFVFTLEQEISDEKAIGKYEPGKYRGNKGSDYHQVFEAPKAKVLIVDDNSANLLVASKLLRNTKVQIKTATSGAEALKETAADHYNIILMDHMMPEMDGIQCLHAIREQSGGLCKDVPVVALTANAGSENQAMYRREGFDAYLLKPVEAVELEKTLLELLPEDLVQRKGEEGVRFESDVIVRQMRRKIPILITTDSICDLPKSLIRSLKIPVLPYKVYTDKAVFSDGVEAEGDVVLRYLGKNDALARSEAPEPSEYEAFFAEQLSYAQHIIHIALAKNGSRGYANACEAALSFYNVKVFDSGSLSSGTGIVTMAAKALVDGGQTDTDVIIRELEKLRPKVSTSFIMDTTEYLYRGGRMSETIYKICNAFLLHPVIELKNSALKVGEIIIGSRAGSRRRYIEKTLKNPSEIDTSVLFITYVGMKKSEIEEIRDEVLKIVPFEKVYLQKATTAIAINCGPGTFGLLFARK